MKKKNKKFQRAFEKEKKSARFVLPEEIKNKIAGVVLFLLALIIALSFFELSGPAGQTLKTTLLFLVGRTVFVFPLILLLAGLIFFSAKYKKFSYSLFLAIFIFILGISGILECLEPGKRSGGYLGYLIAWPFLKLFDFWVTQIIFLAFIIVSGIIFWHLLKQPITKEEKRALLSTDLPAKDLAKVENSNKQGLIRKIFAPRFKIKEISPAFKESQGSSFGEIADIKKIIPELKTKSITDENLVFAYQPPPTNLLESEKGGSNPGDTKINAAIIKKTLQNFDILVEMSEINIGPTVTQYTLKPAEGVKLSKITALSNDLALALASHPIRIEAPIPGKSLVGIEIPNKVRTQVRLRNLIENPDFQKSSSFLNIILGRDVSGNSVYADLSRMPHLLISGSTGTGKTIMLNNLILSLIYRNSPEILKFILIDPKRVELTAYNRLPHLLCPVIYDANQAINALKWLISEMERRFDILSGFKTRDIVSYNALATKKEQVLPYVVLIIDELADLMAAKGREIEAGIVRLAQMARAVGIHLVVATQRPSVEVITGLIKANITSRITFQVASQVDSRTVLDMAGAEKLLGSGDLLYLSAETGKPRRIQAAYVSEKEVKRVIGYFKDRDIKLPEAEQSDKSSVIDEGIFKNQLVEDLEKTLEDSETEEGIYGEEDPLYEEAKKEVIVAKKASASFLQRRLRIGYARAARLLDILEERGVIGPGEGAKPREVYIKTDEDNKENENWQKI